jgi:hypothetical protein
VLGAKVNQEDNRFFRTLWRFNALAIAVAASAGSIAALVALYMVFAEMTRNRDVYQSIRTDPAPVITDVIRLGSPERVTGTDFIAYPAMREQTSQGASYFKKDSQGNEVNRYFVNRTTGAGQWLSSGNQNLILSSQWLFAVEPANSSNDKLQTSAAVYVVVEKDTNKDLVLNAKDISTVAISNFDGTGYAVLVTDVDEVQSIQQISATMLIVSYTKQEKQNLEAFNFSTKSSVWRKEIIAPTIP